MVDRNDVDTRIAKYIAETDYDDIPSNVADVTKRSFLDGLGTMLAATGLGEGCKEFANLAIEGGGKAESTIIGSNTKVPSYMAAYANGALSHAMDYENTGPSGHPNADAIDSGMAIAESIGNVSGKEFITAVTLGCDTVCRLALASLREGGTPETSGWYPPSIYGTFGAAAASAKLLKLSPEQILDAFSLAMCQSTCSAELIFSPNSLVRAVRDAFAAKAGVLSALLAQRGIRGFDRPIGGKAGFYTMYSQGKFNPDILVKDLGKVFESANVSFKPWPSCAGTHPYAAAALQISENYDINPDDIDEAKFILTTTNTMLCEPIQSKRKPSTAIDAKFSIPFVVATALVHKKVTLGHFLPQALVDQEVLKVAQKIIYEIDVKTEPRQGGAVPEALIQVKTKGKNINSKAIEFIYGYPQNPISQEALIAKFKDCASYTAKKISGENLDKLVEMILHLEDVKNMNQIMECL